MSSKGGCVVQDSNWDCFSNSSKREFIKNLFDNSDIVKYLLSEINDEIIVVNGGDNFTDLEQSIYYSDSLTLKIAQNLKKNNAISFELLGVHCNKGQFKFRLWHENSHKSITGYAFSKEGYDWGIKITRVSVID